MIFENWNARTLVAVVSGEQHGICIHQPSSQHLPLSHLLLPVHVLPEFRWGTLLEAGPQTLQRAFGGNTVFSLTQVHEQKVIPSSDIWWVSSKMPVLPFWVDFSLDALSAMQCPQKHSFTNWFSLWHPSKIEAQLSSCRVCVDSRCVHLREPERAEKPAEWTDWSLSFNLALPGLCGLRQSSYPLWVLWPSSIKWEGEREPSNLTVGRRCSYKWHSAHC